MQDPDPKCRHFGILWHFGIFAKKSDKITNPIFPILSDFFRFLDFSWLLDFQIPQLYSKCCSTISNNFKDLHVGVLGRGNLSAVGKVDVSLLGKRSVDVLVVDVLDHWLKREEFNYHFIEKHHLMSGWVDSWVGHFVVSRSCQWAFPATSLPPGLPFHFLHSDQLPNCPNNRLLFWGEDILPFWIN